MSGIKRIHAEPKYQSEDGNYVLHSDHEAEVVRLRAEVNSATKAGLDAIATICEKEREADALRVDAERYRWLKDGGKPAVGYLELMSSYDGWDDAIDAAMGEGK